MSTVIIGHARGGDPTYTPGDQTGNEVRTQPWYDGGWTVVLRPKDPQTAERAAACCEAVCANDAVGYSQSTRNTLRAEMQKAGWDARKITAPCNCDCSSLQAVCAEAAGVKVPYVRTSAGENAPVTWTMRSVYVGTGRYEALTDAKYLRSPDYLRRGDVLVNEQTHTAMVLSDGAKAREGGEQSGEAETPPTADKPSGGVSVGDTVQFTGRVHYTSSTGGRGYIAQTGPARVTAVAPGAKHPYHLIHTDNTSNVYGWVDADKVSPLTERTHTVVWGDTLWALSRRYGTTIPAIREANGLGPLSVILPGQILKIPN